jgi:anti-anti-sigma factor
MPRLNVTVENTRDVVILRCEGRLVGGEEAALLCAALQYGPDISLELSGVTAVDADGLGALLALQAAGIYLRLENPSEPVRQILHSAGLDSIFGTLPQAVEPQPLTCEFV